MRRLLGDRDAAARMGRQARVDAAEFNYDRMADAFEGAVEYAVAARLDVTLVDAPGRPGHR